jgi:HD-like signal output (HDOD) protein
LLTNSTIEKYISTIPPVPKVVKSCLAYLNASDMIQAANTAKEDKAFMLYLCNIVDKPIFGFAKEIKDANQIFGILGLNRAKQIVYGYYMLLILPKKWEVFDFSNKKFQNLQSNLIVNWDKILDFLGISDKDMRESIVLLPAALIVCEMLFRDIKGTIFLLRESKQVNFDELLLKMSGNTLFDVTGKIAKKWEFSKNIEDFIISIPSQKLDANSSIYKPIIFLRLLLSYEMSKPYIVQSGLNDLFDFPLEFDENDMLDFYSLMEN